MAIVAGSQALLLPVLSYCLQTIRGAEAAVRTTGLQQLLAISLVSLNALGLGVGTVVAANLRAFVPIETEVAQAIQEPVQRLRVEAFLVGVLYADDELTAIAAGKQVVE